MDRSAYGNVADDQGTPVPMHNADLRPRNHARSELRSSMSKFVQCGCIKKDMADILYRFCCTEKGPWILSDNDNHPAPLPPQLPTDSSGMSASSSRSSQNPAPQPQTPTLEHNPSLAQHYILDHHQQPQDDVAELKPFLLRLLAPSTKGMSPPDRDKVRDLWDRSTLPGHGTELGFAQLCDEATPVKPPHLDGLHMAFINNAHASSPGALQHIPSLQAPARLRLQDQPITGYQPLQPARTFSNGLGVHQTPSPPYLGLPSEQRRDQISPYPMLNGEAHPANRSQHLLPSAFHSQLTSAHPPSFNHATDPPRRGSNSNTVPPTPQASPPVKNGQLSRQERNGSTSTAQSLPMALKKATVKDEKGKEIAACTIALAIGQPCSWRSASDKPWKAGIDHIRDQHPENFRPQLVNANKGNFESMQRGDEVLSCPWPDVGDKTKICGKPCAGSYAWRSLVEHIRRKHCQGKDGDDKELVEWKTYYLAETCKRRPELSTGNQGLKSNQETVDFLFQLHREKMGLVAPAMQSSVSLSSVSSGESRDSYALQQDHIPQDAVIQIPTPLSPPAQQAQQQHFGIGTPQYINASQCVVPASLHMNPSYSDGYQDSLVPSSFAPLQLHNDSTTVMTGEFAIVSNFHNRNPVSTQDPTLCNPLFDLDDKTSTLQPYGSTDHFSLAGAFQQPQNGVYQQPGHGEYGRQILPGMVNHPPSLTSEPLACPAFHHKPSSRKREREDEDAVEEECQGPSSKRTSTRNMHSLPDTSPSSTSPSRTMHEGNFLGDLASSGGSHISPVVNDPGHYHLDHQSGVSAPPVDDVGSSGGLTSFDPSNIGVASIGDFGGVGEEYLDFSPSAPYLQ